MKKSLASKFNFALILIICGISPSVDCFEPSLKSVQIVFRHGTKFVDDGYLARTGLLQNSGKAQMHELGKYIRERYDGFISESYDPADFEILTSGSNRCVQSGALFAYGLYEEYNRRANWSTDDRIPFDPIPVQTIPAPLDKYLQVTYPCPLRDYFKAEGDTAVAEYVFEEYPQLLEGYANETGDDTVLGDTLSALEKFGRIQPYFDYAVYHLDDAPEWFKEANADGVIQNGKLKQLEVEYEPEEHRQLRTGPFYQLLSDRMNVSGHDFKKMYAYASHDFSITALTLLFVGNFTTFPADPPTGSAYIIEVHQIDANEELFLKVYFRNDTNLPPWEIQDVFNCGNPCTVSNFRDIVQEFIPDDYDALCRKNPEPASTKVTVMMVIMATVGSILAVAICLGLVNICKACCCCCKRKRYSRL